MEEVVLVILDVGLGGQLGLQMGSILDAILSNTPRRGEPAFKSREGKRGWGLVEGGKSGLSKGILP